VVGPTERYHAARFRADALRVIVEVRDRHRLPVVVGGTGLYVRALLHGLRPAPPADPALRAALGEFARRHGAPALHARLAEREPATAERLHPNDLVRVVRALEVLEHPAPAPPTGDGDWARAPGIGPVLVIGLSRDRTALNRLLAERVRAMVARGMLEEVRRLLAQGVDESAPGMAGIGYRSFCAVARGALDESVALRLMIRDTTRYAKRQMTWFRRDAVIRWMDVDHAGGLAAVADLVMEQVEQEGLIG
jgi:tRNA dimethylallyltransferase